MNRTMNEVQFITQHMNELENEMRAALERGDKATALIMNRELKKLEKARMATVFIN